MVPQEFRPYKGSPDELGYRAASPEEEQLCHRTEKNGRIVLPSYIGFIAIFVVMVLLYRQMHGLDIFSVVILSFMALSILAGLPSVLSLSKKSIPLKSQTVL